MGYRHGNTNISKFVADCGAVMYAPRPKRQRERGHVKNFWCVLCNQRHGFTEIREFDFYQNMDGEELV